jgi:hypothetical protein
MKPPLEQVKFAKIPGARRRKTNGLNMIAQKAEIERMRYS